eukprot:CAMPEP_0172403464 /NCGR_PEP_ID=MMETSP1061-20121228/59406_1 /TAXON_ID=37318 /ORGANISM="Pseudo-nitzschia pungens, Strain cf. pungens" /LENGTH=73 /DNA_ID=CAMNT_0013137889 /DNA_START=68 /DNA_END=286 /DNA_ORIENTATION=+
MSDADSTTSSEANDDDFGNPRGLHMGGKTVVGGKTAVGGKSFKGMMGDYEDEDDEDDETDDEHNDNDNVNVND